MKKIMAAWAVYYTVAFLTGAYYYQHRCNESEVCSGSSIFAGIFWPLYWSSRVSLVATEDLT